MGISHDLTAEDTEVSERTLARSDKLQFVVAFDR